MVIASQTLPQPDNTKLIVPTGPDPQNTSIEVTSTPSAVCGVIVAPPAAPVIVPLLEITQS